MKAEKLSSFPWKILLDWYRKNGRHHLPWRDYSLNSDTLVYRVWLSEILLQQTQASRVVGFFNKMIERFPSVSSLAETDYDTFFPYYQGLGYYSRARNLLKTAQKVAHEYHGIFPNDKKNLSTLPGVGGYTSSAILAFGYGEPYLAWDTNLEKVFARYYNGDKNQRLSDEEKGRIEEEFRMFVSQSIAQSGESEGDKLPEPDDSTGKKSKASEFLSLSEPFGTFQLGKVQETVRAINNALMDFASLVDLKNPETIDWGNYPLKTSRFYESLGTLEESVTKSSVTFPIPDASIVVILHQDHKIYYSSGVRHPELAKDPEFQKHGFFLRQNDGNQEPNNSYSPFILAPSLHRDTRGYVQSYFREHYGLELSVRPPHKKWFSKDGKPYIAVNAQIQVGEVTFQKWNKNGERV